MSKPKMSGEVLLSRLPEDFEPGDEVYNSSVLSSIVVFGEVIKLLGDNVAIRLDDGKHHVVPVSEFRDLNLFEDPWNIPSYFWGKLLPYKELNPGDTLSRMADGQSREYATLQKLELPENGQLGRLDLLIGMDEFSYVLKDLGELKFRLTTWELEG